MQAYLTTLALFVLGWQLRLFSPSRVYDLFGEILSALNIFSLVFCAFLYFKVRLCGKGTRSGIHHFRNAPRFVLTAASQSSPQKLNWHPQVG